MKLEEIIAETIYDSGLNKESAKIAASNIMPIFRSFLHREYLEDCEYMNGTNYCKNCGLNLNDII